jgi:hypothetical protein
MSRHRIYVIIGKEHSSDEEVHEAEWIMGAFTNRQGAEKVKEQLLNWFAQNPRPDVVTDRNVQKLRKKYFCPLDPIYSQAVYSYRSQVDYEIQGVGLSKYPQWAAANAEHFKEEFITAPPFAPAIRL